VERLYLATSSDEEGQYQISQKLELVGKRMQEMGLLVDTKRAAGTGLVVFTAAAPTASAVREGPVKFFCCWNLGKLVIYGLLRRLVRLDNYTQKKLGLDSYT
jgi:hypothetical protein